MGGHENSATVKDFWRSKTQNQVCNESMQHAGTYPHCVSWLHQSLASKHTTHKLNYTTSNILAKDLRLWCIIHWVVFIIQVFSSYINTIIQLDQRLLIFPYHNISACKEPIGLILSHILYIWFLSLLFVLIAWISQIVSSEFQLGVGTGFPTISEVVLNILCVICLCKVVLPALMIIL